MAMVACSKESKVPDWVLAKEQMVPFIIDIHIAEAKIRVLKLDYDSSLAFFRKLEDDIYQKHEITDSIYIKSFNYYMDHPDLMLEIYEQVIDSLSLQEKVSEIQ